METARGKSVLGGIAIGPLHVCRRRQADTPSDSALTPSEEWARFEIARETARRQLSGLYHKAVEEVGEETASILESHRVMLADEDYLDAVQEAIRDQGATAEHAASAAGDRFAADLASVEDPYLQARASDVRDVSRRVVNVLSGTESGGLLGDFPAILAADNLSPGETVQLDKSRLLGFITRRGSVDSHTSILARTMSIPALVGVDFDESWDGRLAVLDGYRQCLYIDPTPEVLAAAMEARLGGAGEPGARRKTAGP